MWRHICGGMLLMTQRSLMDSWGLIRWCDPSARVVPLRNFTKEPTILSQLTVDLVQRVFVFTALNISSNTPMIDEAPFGMLPHTCYAVPASGHSCVQKPLHPPLSSLGSRPYPAYLIWATEKGLFKKQHLYAVVQRNKPTMRSV